jgi:hypothetical protein
MYFSLTRVFIIYANYKMHILSSIALILSLAAIGLAIAALVKLRGKDHYSYNGQERVDKTRDRSMLDYELSQAIGPQ